MGKRGRPTKEPSAEDHAKVADLLAKKVPIEDMAKMFRMSKPTFRKYFQAEIFTGKKSGSASTVPSRTVTPACREKVERYLGFGMSPEDVALVLGYTGDGEFKQFQADFAMELRIGRAKARAMTLDRLEEQSRGGLIGATNKLEALSRPAIASERSAPSSSEYVGKKAQAAADAAAAVAAGGKFAPRSAPRLVASGGKPVDDA